MVGAFGTSQGIIPLNSPEGVHRIWTPTQIERLQLVAQDLHVLAYYGALEPWQRLWLEQPLEHAIDRIDGGQTQAARSQLRIFEGRLGAFVLSGTLTQQQADDLILQVNEVPDRL